MYKPLDKADATFFELAQGDIVTAEIWNNLNRFYINQGNTVVDAVNILQTDVTRLEECYQHLGIYYGEGEAPSWAYLQIVPTGDEGLSLITWPYVVDRLEQTYALGKKTPGGGEIFNDYENNLAQGNHSHAEGNATKAVGADSHAEGKLSTASGKSSHAEGEGTTASGERAHAEGFQTIASGDNSHAGGEHTIASGLDQTVVGKYNQENQEALLIVGNGRDESARTNAFEVLEDGSAILQTTGTTPNSITTKQYVDSEIQSSVDQTYNSTSENAQSGKAVEEAILGHIDTIYSGSSPNAQCGFAVKEAIESYIDSSFDPTSQNAQSGIAVAEALQGANSQWKKLADVTITEEVNTIAFTHEDMPRCKEFVVRQGFPVSTTGETVSLGSAHWYLNDTIIAFRFSATDVNKSVVTEQRAHILIADDLIYSTGADAARGQAAIICDSVVMIGNRRITNNVEKVSCQLTDTTKSWQVGTEFQVYGKVGK